MENTSSNCFQLQTWFWLLAAFLILTLSTGRVTADIVNINKADTAAMQEHLPGIGPVKSQAIVDYRKKHGPFKSIDDLKNVPGIGDATVKKIRSKTSTSKGVTKSSKGFKAKSASGSSSKSESSKSVSTKDSKSSSSSKQKSKDSIDSKSSQGTQKDKSSKSDKSRSKPKDAKKKSDSTSMEKDGKKKSSSSGKNKASKPKGGKKKSSTNSKSKDKKSSGKK